MQTNWTPTVDDLFTLLEKKDFSFDLMFDGYKNSYTNEFFHSRAVSMWPGDIAYYLRTGFVRNIHIFDQWWFQSTPESLGFKAHKDGRCVKIRRIK